MLTPDTRPSRRRFRRHANPLSMVQPLEEGSCLHAFGRPLPLWLDIGCGPGSFVCELARARPDMNVLGIEIRQHLVEQGLRSIAADGLPNAHIALANANLHLDTLLGEQPLSAVTINFPDPWFKRRHRKRRVITPQFATWLRARLLPGGEIHAMTDVEALAESMRTILTQAGFVDQCKAHAWPSQSTTGSSTERERWHMGRMDPVWRMHFCSTDTLL